VEAEIRPKWQDRVLRIFREWRSNLIVWLVQWIGGSAIVSAIGHALWREFHRAPLDWYFIGAVFIGGLVLVIVGIWLQQRHTLSTEEKLKEIEAKIPSISVNNVPIAAAADRNSESQRRTLGPTSKLIIHHAVYAAIEGGGKTYDVTLFMRQIVAGDSLVLDIENHNFVVGNKNFVPYDPKPDKPKRLQLTYSYDGEPTLTIERREHSRLVLPEDTEVKKSEAKVKSWESIADADAENMAQRIITCATCAKLNIHAAEPYIEVTFDLVNASMFHVMSESIEGNATYQWFAGERHPFSRTPVIVNPPFTLAHGSKRELKIQQFVPSSLTDKIASGGGKMNIDFSPVSIDFRFAGGKINRFTLCLDVVEVRYPD